MKFKKNKDIRDLRLISNNTSKDISQSSLDRVYNEILLPEFKRRAKITKTNEVRITDNIYQPSVYALMGKLFNNKFTLQSLIETEMKFYLINKGFKVQIWSPKYSVVVSW